MYPGEYEITLEKDNGHKIEKAVEALLHSLGGRFHYVGPASGDLSSGDRFFARVPATKSSDFESKILKVAGVAGVRGSKGDLTEAWSKLWWKKWKQSNMTRYLTWYGTDTPNRTTEYELSWNASHQSALKVWRTKPDRVLLATLTRTGAQTPTEVEAHAKDLCLADFEKRERELGEDLSPGGRADDASPSDFDPAELAKGTKHEMEHTSDEALAREIAMDHLAENPTYYSDLAAAKIECAAEAIAESLLSEGNVPMVMCTRQSTMASDTMIAVHQKGCSDIEREKRLKHAWVDPIPPDVSVANVKRWVAKEMSDSQGGESSPESWMREIKVYPCVNGPLMSQKPKVLKPGQCPGSGEPWPSSANIDMSMAVPQAPCPVCGQYLGAKGARVPNHLAVGKYKMPDGRTVTAPAKAHAVVVAKEDGRWREIGQYPTPEKAAAGLKRYKNQEFRREPLDTAQIILVTAPEV